jgi:hypothetical protein
MISVGYLLARRLLGCLMVLARREVSKDAELLVLRHENAVLRRQISRVRYQPADRLWLAALSRLICSRLQQVRNRDRWAPRRGIERCSRWVRATRDAGPLRGRLRGWSHPIPLNRTKLRLIDNLEDAGIRLVIAGMCLFPRCGHRT